jgi:hypothetical protein
MSQMSTLLFRSILAWVTFAGLVYTAESGHGSACFGDSQKKLDIHASMMFVSIQFAKVFRLSYLLAVNV